MAEIIFPTFNVSMARAVEIIKYHMDDPDIPIATKVLAIDHVAHMETHNSIGKGELVSALRWLFDHYDFEEEQDGIG